MLVKTHQNQTHNIKNEQVRDEHTFLIELFQDQKMRIFRKKSIDKIDYWLMHSCSSNSRAWC